jgi:hypothetical protein
MKETLNKFFEALERFAKWDRIISEGEFSKEREKILQKYIRKYEKKMIKKKKGKKKDSTQLLLGTGKLLNNKQDSMAIGFENGDVITIPKSERNSRKGPGQFSDYLFDLYKEKHQTEYKKFLEKANMSEAEMMELKNLIEIQTILKASHKLIGPLDIEASAIQAYIRDYLTPNLTKIHYQVFAPFAKDAVEAKNFQALEQIRKDKGLSEESPHFGIVFKIALFAAVIITFISASEGFLYFIGSAFINATVFIPVVMEKIRENREFFKSLKIAKIASERFLNTSLLEVENFYSFFEEAEEPIEDVIDMDTMVADGSADPGVEEPPPPVSTEKKKYKIYSHEFPDRDILNEDDYWQHRAEYEKDINNYVFIVDVPGNNYYFRGKTFSTANSDVMEVLKLFLKNRGREVTYEDIYEAVEKERKDELSKSERANVHIWMTFLRNCVGNKLKVYFQRRPNVGYFVFFSVDTKFCYIDYYRG